MTWLPIALCWGGGVGVEVGVGSGARVGVAVGVGEGARGCAVGVRATVAVGTLVATLPGVRVGVGVAGLATTVPEISIE
jgi:hypothetical protein